MPLKRLECVEARLNYQLLVGTTVNWFGNHFAVGNRSRIERRSSPRNINRHAREVDNAAIAAVATKVVRRAHEDAVDRTRFDTQSAEHALGVIDGVAGDFEALASLDTFFADVNTIDGARLRALIAGDASCEVEAMKASVSGRNRYRQLWVFEMFGEGLALWLIRRKPVAKRHAHAVANGVDCLEDIAEPGPPRLHLLDNPAHRSIAWG